MKYKLETGGSEHGISGVEQTLRCPTRHRLNKKLNDKRRVLMVKGPAGTGTIGHAFMDLYFSKKVARGFDPDDVDFIVKDKDKVLFVDEKARATASDVFRFFRAKYDQRAIGQVLHTEHSVRVEHGQKGKKGPDWLPHGMVLTGRLDAVVKLTARNIKKFCKTWNINVKPGVYPLDYKFIANLRPVVIEKYLHGLQGLTYPRLLKHQHPKYNVNGMLYLFITKAAVPQMQMRLVRLEDIESRAHILQHQLSMVRDLEQHPCSPYFVTDCFAWDSHCPHMLSGDCEAWR